MWGLGALREGAAGLVKHGAGAVKHGVEAGAKLLENLDENFDEDDPERSYSDSDYEHFGGAAGDNSDDDGDGDSDFDGKGPTAPRHVAKSGKGRSGDAGKGNEFEDPRGEGSGYEKPPPEGNLDDAFGLDPTSDEFQAVKREMERLARNHAFQMESNNTQVKKLQRKMRRVKGEAEMMADELQPQLRNLVDTLKSSKAEIAELEEQLSVASRDLVQEREAHGEDVESLQAQLRQERMEGDSEKEGLMQTVQLLQKEMGDQGATLNEANQRLEQALLRSLENEENSANLMREAEELRERLSAALSSTTAVNNIDETVTSSTINDLKRDLETSNTAIDNLKKKLETSDTAINGFKRDLETSNSTIGDLNKELETSISSSKLQAAVAASAESTDQNTTSPLLQQERDRCAEQETTIDGLRRELEQLAVSSSSSSKLQATTAAPEDLPDTTSTLALLQQERERWSELTQSLSQEQTLSQDLRTDMEGLLERAEEAENIGDNLRTEVEGLLAKAEGAKKVEGDLRTDMEGLLGRAEKAENTAVEAMKAAETEASRGAELRDCFENAEAEMLGLRERMVEWEEEFSRATELKRTLEMTRDALDELRMSAGQSEAAAERRLRELGGQLKEASSKRDELQQQLDSALKEAADELRVLESRHETAMEEAVSRAESSELKVCSLKEDLSLAKGHQDELENTAVALAEAMELKVSSLEEAMELKVSSLEEALSWSRGQCEDLEKKAAATATTVEKEEEETTAADIDNNGNEDADNNSDGSNKKNVNSSNDENNRNSSNDNSNDNNNNSSNNRERVEELERSLAEAREKLVALQQRLARQTRAEASGAQQVLEPNSATRKRTRTEGNKDTSSSSSNNPLGALIVGADNTNAAAVATATVVGEQAAEDLPRAAGPEGEASAPSSPSLHSSYQSDGGGGAVAAAVAEEDKKNLLVEALQEGLAESKREKESSAKSLAQAEAALATARKDLEDGEAQRLSLWTELEAARFQHSTGPESALAESAVALAEHAEYASRVAGLEVDLTGAQEALQTAEGHVAGLEADIASAREALHVTKQDLKESREAEAEAKAEADSRGALAAAAAAVTGQQQQQQQLANEEQKKATRVQVEELERQVEDKGAALEVEAARADSAVRQVEKLRVLLEGNTNKEGARVAVGEAEAASVRAEAAELERKLEVSLQELALAEEALAKKQAEVGDALSRLSASEQELNAASRTLESVKEGAEATASSAATAAIAAAATVADATAEAETARAAASEVAGMYEKLELEHTAAANGLTATANDLTVRLETAKQTAATLRHQVNAAEATIVDMDAKRARAGDEVAALRAELQTQLAASVSATDMDRDITRAKEQTKEEVVRAQEIVREELEAKWMAVVEKKALEVNGLRAGLSKAEESLAQSLSDASSAEEKSAQALAESEGAAQIAAWEAKSLREELETLRQRSQELSQELSSELEKARSRESSALKTAESSVIGELDGLRQAAKEAEKRSELAENGLARMKEKKKRDLQEVRRLNQRMIEQQQSRHDEIIQLDATVVGLNKKVTELEKNEKHQAETLAQALGERDELQRSGASPRTSNSTASEVGEVDTAITAPLSSRQQSQQQQQQQEDGEIAPHSDSGTGNGNMALQLKGGGIKDGDGGKERQQEQEHRQEQDSKEVLLLRNLVEKLQREVEGLKSDLGEASTGQREADDARQTLTAALTRGNARIAELTSKTAQLSRARAAMVDQIRALEEEANSNALKHMTESPHGLTPLTEEEGSEASPVPLMESAALSMDSRAPMRQRHRPSAGGSDIEDGGSKTGMVGIFPGQDGYVDDEDKSQAKPGDLVKSLLISCALSPVGVGLSERFPGGVTWLHQQQPQTLWIPAVVYLALIHVLALYKTLPC